MTNQHPITPPPELVQQWVDDFAPLGMLPLCIQAAQWGADQELEACCEWTQCYAECGDSLRAARRPKPPSLKEQALAALKRQAVRSVPSLIATEDCDTIRRALEALPE